MAQTLEAIFFHGDEQKRMDYTPGGALAVGEIVLLNGFCGIVTGSQALAAGRKASLARAGNFKVKKAVGGGVTFARGAPVRWDDTANTAVVAGSGDADIGIALYASADGDDHVVVAINEQALPDNSA